MKSDNKRVVIGVIGADIHVVGNKVIESALRNGGFEVTNLGIFTTQEDFIHVAKETDAAAIIVSSLYGHGELDCDGLRGKCIESGMPDIKLYVGGNLVVGKHDPEEVREKFIRMGFDRVGSEKTMPGEIIDWLREDLALNAGA
jgi:methylaspartate mutase sigma subunit